tara:strand:- start:2234 stop:2971 length:738 start_codon:yes stop_codon:yes gene_type:complete
MSDLLTQLNETTEETTTQETENYLDNLVGDGKKYRTMGDLAKAYHNADIHIHELREKLDDMGDIHNVVNDLRTQMRTITAEPPAPVTDTASGTAGNSVSVEDIKRIAAQTVAEHTSNTERQQKQDSALTALDQRYGSRDKALAAVNQIIQNNPEVKEVINTMGQTSPDVLVNFVTSQVPPTEAPRANTPGVNTSPAHAQIPSMQQLSWTYCRKVRKEDPQLYNSAEFRLSMERAVNERGDKFFNT